MRFPVDTRSVIPAREDLTLPADKGVVLPMGTHPGSFGFPRKHHVHEGVDLYVPEGTLVYACEPGIFRGFFQFTGPEVGSPWWRTTFAALIELADGSAALYGEIAPFAFNIPDGYPVGEGNILGCVTPVLRTDKGRPMTMLHFERYAAPTVNAAEWHRGEPQPAGLLDPTEYLLRAARAQGVLRDA